MKSGICFKHQDIMGSQEERRKLLRKSGLEYESKTQYVTFPLFFCDSLHIFFCDTSCVSKFGRGFCSCFTKQHIKNNLLILDRQTVNVHSVTKILVMEDSEITFSIARLYLVMPSRSWMAA